MTHRQNGRLEISGVLRQWPTWRWWWAVLLWSIAPVAHAAWLTLGAAGFSTDEAHFTVLAFGADGRPHVAYTDYAVGQRVTVMRLDAADLWAPVGGAGFSADNTTRAAFAFGPDARPYVAYSDPDSAGRLTVMRLNAAGTGWELVGGQGVSGDVVSYVSLAFGADGRPYVAYSDGAVGNRATVMRLNPAGTGWDTVGGAGFSAGTASYTALAFGSDDRPYVLYTDGNNGGSATVMRLNAGGTGWETVGSAGFSAGPTDYNAMARGPDGTLFVAFADQGLGGRATVMRLNAGGTAWELVGAAAASTGAAYETTLAISPDGRPYVGYQDSDNGWGATVMRPSADGTTWELVGSAGFSADRVSYPSLAFSPEGWPTLAFTDFSLSLRATVLQWQGVPSAPRSVSATAGAGQVTVAWTVPAVEGLGPVQTYTATAGPGGASCTATAPATSCIIPGLTPGVTYSVTVLATNVEGRSVASLPASAVPTMAAGVTPVPLLGPWAIAVLSGLVGWLGWTRVGRNRVA